MHQNPLHNYVVNGTEKRVTYYMNINFRWIRQFHAFLNFSNINSASINSGIPFQPSAVIYISY